MVWEGNGGPIDRRPYPDRAARLVDKVNGAVGCARAAAGQVIAGDGVAYRIAA